MNEEKELSLAELLSHLFKYKIMILGITLLFAIFSVFYTLSLPNKYKAESLLMPVSEDTSANMSGLMSQFGGLAGLAGIDIGKGGQNNVELIIETVRSRAFLAEFINKYNLIIPILAASGWDRETNTLVIDDSLYDQSTSTWVRTATPPRKATPTVYEAVEELRDIATIKLDDENGFVTIAVEFYSPYLAKQWVEWMVQDANHWIRSKKKQEVDKSIQFLSEQAELTNVVEMKTSFYKLIEEQIKTKMLTEVREEYALKVIDPATLPELKSSPMRALICIVITLAGLFISTLAALFRK